MGAIRLLTAPIRRIASSRLFQFAVVVAIVLLLDHFSYDYAALHASPMAWRISSPPPCSCVPIIFRVGILTNPVLQVGLMIAVCLS